MSGESLAANDKITLADGTVLTVTSVSETDNSFVATDADDGKYNGYIVAGNLYVFSGNGNINDMEFN